MGDLAVELILAINHLFPMLAVHRELASAKRSALDYQAWEYDEIRRISPEFGDDFDLHGRSLLDIGCGLGGKLRFYAERGASQVIGVDLRFRSLEAAKRFNDPGHVTSTSTRVLPEMMLADGAELPFADKSFDVVISINVLEHVDDPKTVLRSCYRVLRPEGLLLLHFPPFYSPWGPHLDGWINWPWPHLFFSEKHLVAAAARVEERLHLNDKIISSGRMDWSEYSELPELSRLTIKVFDGLVDDIGFRRRKWELLPFGRHYLLTKGLLGRLVLSGLRSLVRLPLLAEAITTKIVCVLQRPPE